MSEIRTLFQKEMKGFWGNCKRILFICAGAVLMSLNLKMFAKPAGLIPGGFTGLVFLIQGIFQRYKNIQIPFSLLLYLCNLVPAIISFKFIGKKFTLYSALMIFLSGLLTDLIPLVPIADDPILAAIFGGMLNAVAVSLCLFAGATSGGTDFIAIFISERFGRDAWNYIFMLNICILSAAGFLFGWEKALYSIVFQFSSTQVLNSVYRRYQKSTLLVITNRPEQVYVAIRETAHHDATVFQGTGSYSGEERDLVYSVVSGDEVRQVIPAIRKRDKDAFVNVLHSSQILGRFYLRPND